MKKPNLILDNHFYFYRGYIIRLYGNGSYAMYKTHMCGAMTNKTEDEQLTDCMAMVDEIWQEKDKEEKQAKEMDLFLKQFKPHLQAISNEILKNIAESK